MESNIAENNGRLGNGQHPSISRLLPLFDVQIFTMPRRACLRGSCRCVGVLFASVSPRVFVSKFTRLQYSFYYVRNTHFHKNDRFIWKSPRSFYETCFIAANICSCLKFQIFCQKKREIEIDRNSSNRYIFTKKILPIFLIDDSIAITNHTAGKIRLSERIEVRLLHSFFKEKCVFS